MCYNFDSSNYCLSFSHEKSYDNEILLVCPGLKMTKNKKPSSENPVTYEILYTGVYTLEKALLIL